MNNINIKNLFFLIFLIFIFSGCNNKKIYINKINLEKKIPQTKNFNYKTKALYNEYKKWLGTKYKYGGDDLNGVDCSSFVQQIYYNAFGLKIPRTTKEQAKIGYEIKKKELQAGDMVFFKTAWNIRHVGIILEKSKFIHTSTKYGVTTSSVQNPYWKSHYWQSRRVLP